MFGMGFGELVLVIIVAIVMIGPKDLPRVLRTAGQWAGRLRRMALDLRVQSGIDDVLSKEGLADDLQEIRKLARGELDGIRAAATIPTTNEAAAPADPNDPYQDISALGIKHREYPLEGADAYQAMPDTAVVYVSLLPKSPLAVDPLYMTGRSDGVITPAATASPTPAEAEVPSVGPAEGTPVPPPPADTASDAAKEGAP